MEVKTEQILQLMREDRSKPESIFVPRVTQESIYQAESLHKLIRLQIAFGLKPQLKFGYVHKYNKHITKNILSPICETNGIPIEFTDQRIIVGDYTNISETREEQIFLKNLLILDLSDQLVGGKILILKSETDGIRRKTIERLLKPITDVLPIKIFTFNANIYIVPDDWGQEFIDDEELFKIYCITRFELETAEECRYGGSLISTIYFPGLSTKLYSRECYDMLDLLLEQYFDKLKNMKEAPTRYRVVRHMLIFEK